ncbi:MAG TPA: A/G-specific adenine glycosylase [Opitutaceae bacterium]|nr:A/G-specific adenine glycosylase [Opitutaceae bacterium]
MLLTATNPTSVNAFAEALSRWYRQHKRDLPWRRDPSPYKTVVSEFMLQQTQVKTVLPYFARWLDALPDFAALAAAPESQVLKLWEGLGYYSRARNLHKLAKTLVALPAVPNTPEGWRELPGVGPYTAAAITSIAFGAPVACVDGNVVRILSRLSADKTNFRDSATAAKYFTPLAGQLISKTAPGDHNQAMMELGATVCHRRNPLCTICPVLQFCRAGQSGDAEQYPKLAAKTIESVTVDRVWHVREGKLLLHRSSATARRFADMHELPRASDAGHDQASLSHAQARRLVTKKRAITRYAITEIIHDVSAVPLRGVADSSSELVWVALDDLEQITLSGPHRRWIRELLAK